MKWPWTRIESKLDLIVWYVQWIRADQIRLINKQEAQMALVDDILSDVKSESDVITSVETLLGNLSTQLKAALNSAATEDQLKAIIAAIDTNKTRLAADVAANTPAAP